MLPQECSYIYTQPLALGKYNYIPSGNNIPLGIKSIILTIVGMTLAALTYRKQRQIREHQTPTKLSQKQNWRENNKIAETNDRLEMRSNWLDTKWQGNATRDQSSL